jgi:hypothetical protein
VEKTVLPEGIVRDERAKGNIARWKVFGKTVDTRAYQCIGEENAG